MELRKKFLTFLILFISIFVIIKIKPENIREVIFHYPSVSSIIYVLVWTILPVFLFPVPSIALLGGVCFGFFMGSILTIIGAVFNMSLMFLLSRYIFHDLVRKYANTHSNLLTKWINIEDKKVAFSIFILRLTPIIPYNLLNYTLPLTKVKYTKYILISLIGIIPGTFVYINLGAQSVDYKSSDFIIAIILMLGLILITSIIKKFLEKREVI
ncbi:MAG: VTT domain-containing protein [Tissierellia bacterium]|nr:VTT domain-containing protein [Tissierellia bacterium]